MDKAKSLMVTLFFAFLQFAIQLQANEQKISAIEKDQVYSSILSSSPTNNDSVKIIVTTIQSASFLVQEDRLDQAINKLKQISGYSIILRDSLGYYQILGKCLYLQGKFKESLEVLDSSAIGYSDEIEYYRGLNFKGKGEYDFAKQVFKNLISQCIEKRFIDLSKWEIAEIEYLEGHYGKSAHLISDLTNSKHLSKSRTYYYLTLCYHEMNESKKACKCIKKGLRANDSGEYSELLNHAQMELCGDK